MPKLRKQRRRKKFNHNVNRKRMRNSVNGVGKIACKEIEKAWEHGKSIQKNLKLMGLSHDANKTIKLINNKQKLKASLISNNSNEWTEEPVKTALPSKNYIVEQLEAEAKAPRVRLLRLPKSYVEKIAYYLDKYGKDYKAMARDSKNYYQETWRQIRAKIKRFKSIKEQYSEYLESRHLIDSENESETEIESDGDL